jgi:hypothetical protein
VKLDPLLLITTILRLVKRVLQEINNLGVRFCFFLLTDSQSITDELRETERVDQRNKDNDYQTSEDGIVKMTYPSGAGALYNFYSFSETKFTSGADRSPHCTPLFSMLRSKKKIYQ